MSISDDSSFMSSINLDVKNGMYSNQLIATRNPIASKLSFVREYFIFLQLSMLQVICFLPIIVTILCVKPFGVCIISWNFKALFVFRGVLQRVKLGLLD